MQLLHRFGNAVDSTNSVELSMLSIQCDSGAVYSDATLLIQAIPLMHHSMHFINIIYFM